MKNCILFLFIILSVYLNPFISSASPKNNKHQQVNTLKILSYNIRNCRGLDDVTDFQRIANIINRIDADCVALQELDSVTQRLNKADVLTELSVRTKMFPTFRGSIDYQGGKYGIGILTREKPIRTEAVALPGKEEKRSLLVVEMKDYIICCTHFSLTHEDRINSIEIINKTIKKYSKPVFLAGDLNSEPNSAEINKLAEDWTILNNTAKPTSPANAPEHCIDYIAAKKHSGYSVKVMATQVENEPVASDHLPLWVKVAVTGK